MISLIIFIAGFCLGLVVYPIWVKNTPNETTTDSTDADSK